MKQLLCALIALGFTEQWCVSAAALRAREAPRGLSPAQEEEEEEEAAEEVPMAQVQLPAQATTAWRQPALSIGAETSATLSPQSEDSMMLPSAPSLQAGPLPHALDAGVAPLPTQGMVATDAGGVPAVHHLKEKRSVSLLGHRYKTHATHQHRRDKIAHRAREDPAPAEGEGGSEETDASEQRMPTRAEAETTKAEEASETEAESSEGSTESDSGGAAAESESSGESSGESSSESTEDKSTDEAAETSGDSSAEEASEEKSGEKSEETSEEKAEKRPLVSAEESSSEAAASEEKSDDKSEEGSDKKSEETSEEKSEEGGEKASDEKSEEELEEKSEEKSEAKSEAKSEEKSTEKSEEGGDKEESEEKSEESDEVKIEGPELEAPKVGDLPDTPKVDVPSVDPFDPMGTKTTTTTEALSAEELAEKLEEERKENMTLIPHDKVLYKECDPPCIDGRGVCNDRVCFCKNKYYGTTCQHELKDELVQFAFPVVGVICVTACVGGALLAHVVFGLLEEMKKKYQRSFLGDPTSKAETWQPSDSGGSKKGKK